MNTIKNTSLAIRSSLVLKAICLIFAVNSITVLAQSNNTVQGCYNNKTGVLRKVNSPSDCDSKETAISWNVVGPQGVSGPQGPKGDKGDAGPGGSGALRIVDSVGNEVGFYIPQGVFANDATVLRFIPSLDNWFIFTVNKDGFSNPALSFVYESTDCTGQGYVNSFNAFPTDDFFIAAGITFHGIGYYPVGPRVTITPRSAGFTGGECSPTAAPPPGQVTQFPVGTFTISDLV